MNVAAAPAPAMSCLRIPTPNKQLFLLHPLSRTTHITYGLRDGGRRGALWRSDFLTTEAIQAVHSLKLAKSAAQLEIVLKGKLSRLLKADMLNALSELQRQNELDLALEVFKQVKNETWFESDPALYSDMIQLLGKNKKFDMAEELFLEMRKDGGEPDTRAYTEMIGVYFRAGMVEKAVELYEMMKASGCPPDKLTLTIMIRNLETAGEEALATAVKRECFKYVEYPRKFLAEVGRKYPKRRSLDLR